MTSCAVEYDQHLHTLMFFQFQTILRKAVIDILYKKDVLIGNSHKGNIYIADSVKQSSFHVSNIVEGNDVFMHDVLNASNKTCNYEFIRNAHNTPALESNPQVIKQLQERTLHFECDDECLITPRLKKHSLIVDSRKRKHHKEGFFIHNFDPSS